MNGEKNGRLVRVWVVSVCVCEWHYLPWWVVFFPRCFVLFLLGNSCGQSGEQICRFLLHLPIWGTNLTNATAAQLNVSDGAQLWVDVTGKIFDSDGLTNFCCNHPLSDNGHYILTVELNMVKSFIIINRLVQNSQENLNFVRSAWIFVLGLDCWCLGVCGNSGKWGDKLTASEVSCCHCQCLQREVGTLLKIVDLGGSKYSCQSNIPDNFFKGHHLYKWFLYILGGESACVLPSPIRAINHFYVH